MKKIKVTGYDMIVDRSRGRPHGGWMVSVKRVLDARRMFVYCKEEWLCVTEMNRKQMEMNKCDAAWPTPTGNSTHFVQTAMVSSVLGKGIRSLTLYSPWCRVRITPVSP